MKHRERTVGRGIVATGALAQDQSGVTGLETAIILIAFVVVASVFAFTVLSTGIFSAEQGRETVFAGLQEARGTMERKGGLLANGLAKDTISLANAAWTGTTSTTVTLETTDKKEGTGSAKLAIASGFLTGLNAYENITSTLDLTGQTQLQFWIKSTTTTVAGQIEVVLDETGSCVSPEAHIDVPALTANTWKLVTAAITQSDGTTAVTDANKDKITCVGIEIETDLSTSTTETIIVDDISAPGLVTSLVMVLTNAVEGEPVDLIEPSDSDDDGIADSDGNHLMVISYTDDNQLVRDLYWTRAFLGNNDTDHLLEAGERVELTVFLKGLADATPLLKDQEFNLKLQPAIGAVIVVERRIPGVIDVAMNLN